MLHKTITFLEKLGDISSVIAGIIGLTIAGLIAIGILWINIQAVFML